jgi:hypothetical protein
MFISSMTIKISERAHCGKLSWVWMYTALQFVYMIKTGSVLEAHGCSLNAFLIISLMDAQKT